MEDNKYTTDDLVVSAIQQKPVEFENIFGSLMVDRLQAAVETRKQEIAQTMFNPADEESTEQDVEAETEEELETEDQ
jgi:hypothetical protein